MESLQRFVTARRPLSVIASIPVRGWRACYGTGTNNREVSRESTRDQSGRRRCAVRHHVRAGIDYAYEQSRGRSERPRAWPKRALSPPASVPIVQLLLRPLLRLWRRAGIAFHTAALSVVRCDVTCTTSNYH